MTTIEKIKAEIERQLKDPQEHCYGVSSINKLRELLSFLDTLESEKPMNQDELEKEIDKRYLQTRVVGYQDGVGEILLGREAFGRIARHFAKWGVEHAKNSDEKLVPADLEEAANKFAFFYDNGTCDGIAQDCFKAGANWQKQHDAELIEIAYNDGITIGMTKQKEQMMDEWLKDRDGCFWDGVNEGKKAMEEQMMNKAVEYEVWDFSSSLEAYPHINIPLDNKQYRNGDKVRVIVLKKEDEK